MESVDRSRRAGVRTSRGGEARATPPPTSAPRRADPPTHRPQPTVPVRPLSSASLRPPCPPPLSSASRWAPSPTGPPWRPPPTCSAGSASRSRRASCRPTARPTPWPSTLGRPGAGGLKVIMAGAGGAAHLPGMIAASTTLPVVGVPVQTRALDGMDSLLSIVQMPGGVPVATVAIGQALNAGLLAVQILAHVGRRAGGRAGGVQGGAARSRRRDGPVGRGEGPGVAETTRQTDPIRGSVGVPGRAASSWSRRPKTSFCQAVPAFKG